MDKIQLDYAADCNHRSKMEPFQPVKAEPFRSVGALRRLGLEIKPYFPPVMSPNFFKKSG